MRYQQFLDLVLGRARTMTFLNPETRQVDTAEVELAAFQALLEICDGWDLDAFLVINDQMAVTETGRTQYPLPGNFGRLRIPRDAEESGLFCVSDATSGRSPLQYKDAEDWYRTTTTNQGTPWSFTLSGDLLLLDPPPDAHGGVPYTIQGVYVRRVQPLDGDEPLLVSHPTALIAATLARLALDKNAAQMAALVAERDRALNHLVNNQARVRQQFRQRTNQERSMRRGRGW